MAKVKQGITIKKVAKNSKAKYTVKSGISIIQKVKNNKATTKYSYTSSIYINKKYSYK